MHRPRVSPLATGAVAAVVMLAVMSFIFISGIPGGPRLSLPWNQQMTLHVQLADADGLAPQASVEITGVKVGQVESVTAQGYDAIATLQISKQYFDIHRDATVYLRAHGLFGPKYIAIVPGTAASPAVGDGGTIALAQTVEPVDLSAVLQALQSPEQQDLRTTIVELGEAAAGQGQDVNHLITAADSLTRVLDSPLKTVDSVSPQLSSMLVNDEAFNNYFAQAPLDQLVANSERTFQAFANNSSQLESLLSNANSTLTQLDQDLNGQPGNLARIIQTLGQPGGTIDRLDRFTYLLALFGANLNGGEASLGSDPADRNVTNGIIAAITSIASSFIYSDPCPATKGAPGATNDNHCSVSPDSRQHYLQAFLYNFPPSTSPNPGLASYQGAPRLGLGAGNQLGGLGLLLAP